MNLLKNNIIRSGKWQSTSPETGHRIPPLARASGRKTGVGHGTVPPEPRRGMVGYGAAEVRRVPGSLVKSPPVLTLGGPYGAIRFPTRPKAFSGPGRIPAGQAQMLTPGHTQTAQHTANGAMVRCDTHNPTYRVMPMGRRGGTSLRNVPGNLRV